MEMTMLKANHSLILIAISATLFMFFGCISPEHVILMMAEDLAQRGNLDESMALAEKILDENPDSIRGLVLKASVHKHRGEFSDAKLCINKALELGVDDPNFDLLRFEKADIFLFEGSFDLAAQGYSELIEQTSNEEIRNISLMQRSMTYFYQGEYDKAKVDLTQIINTCGDEQKEIALLMRGYIYRIEYKYDDAINDYTEAIKVNPDCATAHVFIGNIYRDKGMTEKAQTEHTKAEAIEPGIMDNYNPFDMPLSNIASGKGHDLLDKGDYDGAIEEYSKALEVEPDSAFLYAMRGWAYYLKNDYTNAISDCTKSVTYNPRPAAAYDTLGWCYYYTGDYKKSRENFDKALKNDKWHRGSICGLGALDFEEGKYDEAISYFEYALRVDPGYGDAREWVIKIYGKSGKPLPDKYKSHIPDSDENPELYKNEKLLNRKADELFRDNYVNDVLELCNKAIEINPENSSAYANRGRAYEKLGDYNKAFADCNKAKEIDPNNALIYAQLGAIYGGMGQSDNAIENFKKAVRLDPQNSRAHSGLAFTYDMLKQYDQAIIEINKAIAIESDYAGNYIKRGKIHEHLNDFEGALSDYTLALKYDPENITTLKFRAAMNARTSRYDDALSDYARIIELAPDNPEVYRLRADHYKSRNMHDEAIADCNRAIKIDPDDPKSYFARGSIYRFSSGIENAVADYETVKKMDPDFAGIDWYIKDAKKYEKIRKDRLSLKEETSKGTADAGKYFELAKMLGQQAKWDEVLENLKKAVELDPDNTEYRLTLAQFYSSGGIDQNEAIKELNKVLALEPACAQAYFLRGQCYFYLNDKKSELNDYNKAIELEPDNAQYYYSRSGTYHGLWIKGKQKSDLDNTIKNLRKATELAIEYVRENRIPIGTADQAAMEQKMLLDLCASKFKDLDLYEECIKLHSLFIELDPDEANNWLQRGRIYEEIGEFKKAESDYEKAVELHPSWEWARTRLKEVRDKM
jgi:tetratricopeptide (TPR) repeat protein